MYVFSLVFFAWFGVFLLVSASAESLVLYKRVLGITVAGGLLIAARGCFASAERQRTAVLKTWKRPRAGTDS